jgi:hypothetical protein
MSNDGSIVIGFGEEVSPLEGGRGLEAFIWNSAHGMRNLSDVLRDEYGLGDALQGWTLDHALDISSDGRIITGRRIAPDDTSAVWIAFLGTPVPEPGTWALALVAAAASLFILRTRRRLL